MNTINLITRMLNDEPVSDIDIEEELESKSKLKKQVKSSFKTLLKDGTNPLLAFQVLYHRLNEIAKIAKDTFYDKAIEYAQNNDPDPEGKFFGSTVSIRTSEDWNVIPSPKIKKLEKEKSKLENKHASAIKAYEAYQIDVKSLNNQIKEEKNRLIEKGMATKQSESFTIALKY